MHVWIVVHEKGPALVRNSTGWMTNSSKIAKTLDRKCSGEHRYSRTSAEGQTNMNKTRFATCERSPIRLVNAVLRALRQKLRERFQLRAPWKLEWTKCVFPT